MSLDERLSTLEETAEQTGSIEDIGECPLCSKNEQPYSWEKHYPKLIQDIVKHFVLSKENLERCTKESHLQLERLNPEIEDILIFFHSALHTTSYFDHHAMAYGVCDIDDSKPREVIKLFLDFDTMEFVLKRHYDKTVDHVLKYGRQSCELTYYHELQLFKGPINLTKFKISYENCREILRQLDKIWLHSLNPDDYGHDDPKFPEYNKRHLGFLIDNITSNQRYVDEKRREFDEWKTKAEQELGKKLTYKNFGDV